MQRASNLQASHKFKTSSAPAALFSATGLATYRKPGPPPSSDFNRSVNQGIGVGEFGSLWGSSWILGALYFKAELEGSEAVDTVQISTVSC